MWYKLAAEAGLLSFSFSQPWPLTQLLLPQPSQQMPSSLARAPLTPSPLNASPRSLSDPLFSFVCECCVMCVSMFQQHKCWSPAFFGMYFFSPMSRGSRWRNSRAFVLGRAWLARRMAGKDPSLMLWLLSSLPRSADQLDYRHLFFLCIERSGVSLLVIFEQIIVHFDGWFKFLETYQPFQGKMFSGHHVIGHRSWEI